MDSPIVVIGHRNPDTDAVGSAIGYAELLRQQGQAAIAARAGEIRPETAHLLERFGLPVPTLVEDLRPRVGEVMTAPAQTVRQTDSLFEVGRKQVEIGMRPLPVTDDDGRLVGIAEVHDFAKAFFQGLGEEEIDRVGISLDTLVRALNARIVVGGEDGAIGRTVMVAAWAVDTIRLRIPFGPSLILVVGDRRDVQALAIEKGVGVLVITGGHRASEEIVLRAKERGASVLEVEHHTATTLRLIHMSAPVSLIMRPDPPSCLPEDLVEEVTEMLRSERALSVVDGSRRIVGVITRADVLRGSRRRVALVDHNERGQAVAGVEQASIVAVIDHHRVADLVTQQPLSMRFEPVGATSTIVARLFEEHGLRPSPAVAGVLLGAIVTDTLIFQSATTTEADREAAEFLCTIAGVDSQTLGSTLLAIASDVSTRSARELLLGDFKTFRFEGRAMGVGVIETGDAQPLLARRGEFEVELSRVRADGFAVVLLVVADIVAHRTAILVSGHARDVARVLGGRLADGCVTVEGILSRKKHIVPALARLAQMIGRGVR